MSAFRVAVLPLDAVEHHPKADRLSLCRIRGFTAVVAKNPDGSHRFAPGEGVLYVPEGAVLPENLLREHGYWNEALGIGKLAGPLGNRVSAIELRGVLSQGLVWALPSPGAAVGEDFAERLGITKYVPEIPPELLGQVAVCMHAKMGYDIEGFLNYPTFFDNDEVAITEKIHGICTQVSFIPGLNDPDLFGWGDVAITSKGLGDQGLVFKNVPENADNPYVRTVLDSDLPVRLRAWAERNVPGEKVAVVSEIFGRGIQDLHYGAGTPIIRGFDVRVGRTWLDEDDKVAALADLGLERVPLLYRGRFDRALADELRSGWTTFDGANIREGIVITAIGSQEKRITDLETFIRPVLKYHSPAYLTRKGGTEYR